MLSCSSQYGQLYSARRWYTFHLYLTIFSCSRQIFTFQNHFSGLDLADILRLIYKEEDVFYKLREIRDSAGKQHRNCSIARTVGASASIAGTVAALTAVGLPGAVVGLSIGGAAAVACGAGISVGATAVQNRMAKKWADELNNALMGKSAEYGRVMKKITGGSTWKNHMRRSSAHDLSGKPKSTAVKRIEKFLDICADEYKICTANSMFLDDAHCAEMASNMGEILTAAAHGLAVPIRLAGVAGQMAGKIILHSAGAATAVLDIREIIMCWMWDPEVAARTDQVIADIAERLKALRKLLHDERDVTMMHNFRSAMLQNWQETSGKFKEA